MTPASERMHWGSLACPMVWAWSSDRLLAVLSQTFLGKTRIIIPPVTQLRVGDGLGGVILDSFVQGFVCQGFVNLSGQCLLNHSTTCNQTWHGAASSCAGWECRAKKIGLLSSRSRSLRAPVTAVFQFLRKREMASLVLSVFVVN